MFLTYLLIAIFAAGTVITVAFTVSLFMTLSDMIKYIQNHDTNGATRGQVEDVVGTYLSKAKTVKVGLFNGSDRVGDVTIECTQGTSVTKGDCVYV
jgi:hypothetical protein